MQVVGAGLAGRLQVNDRAIGLAAQAEAHRQAAEQLLQRCLQRQATTHRVGIEAAERVAGQVELGARLVRQTQHGIFQRPTLHVELMVLANLAAGRGGRSGGGCGMQHRRGAAPGQQCQLNAQAQLATLRGKMPRSSF
ncbi:hypothetical protein D3C76_1519090 [compost metagenome]